MNHNADDLQDIAPAYYDLENIKKGEMRNALQRTMEKVKRKEAIKGGKR